MDNEGRERSPYHGVWVICTIMIAVPLVLFAIVYYAMRAKGSETIYACLHTSLALGFALGSLVHLSFAIVGLFRGTFSVVINRWADFFANAKISFKCAVGWHWQSIKQDGIVFWLYLIIIVATAVVAVNSTFNVLEYYQFL